MKSRHPLLAFAVAALAGASLAGAEAKVTADHNTGDDAKQAFTFKTVPAPAKVAGVTKPTITVVDGDKDDNAGRDAADLATSAMPAEEDQPDSNFFFKDASDGGRLKVDLGSAMPVRQVNTYSWHANTRAPQLYKLYAADGTAAGFNPAPKKGTDPTTCGWTMVASVDTRPKGDAEPGGQYGVSIADPAGPLGTYRYLLLDTSKTEDTDDFGNTFLSRIDVVTAAGPATAPAANVTGGPSMTPAK